MDQGIAGLASHRALFEIPRDVVYLNNASYTPLPRPVRAAGEAGVAAKSTPWTVDAAAAAAQTQAVRTAAANLVGAAPADIALVNAAAYGVATAAANLVVRPGDRILMIANEFPSLALAWARLAEERGAILDIVQPPPDGDWTAALLARIAVAAPRIAVAALTPAVWTDGTLIDLLPITAALRAAGAAIVLDATQAAGVMPIDVVALGVDYAVFPTYKWLLGPYTLAFLYVAPHRQNGRPIEQHGAGRTAGTGPFAGTLSPMVPGAAKFDMGQRQNPVSLPMALAGMTLLEQWGRAALETRLRATTDALAAEAEAAGLSVVPRARRAPHVLGIRPPAASAGGSLVTSAAASLVARLAEAGVHVAERGGTIRVAPHVFNDAEDVARFGKALRGAV